MTVRITRRDSNILNKISAVVVLLICVCALAFIVYDAINTHTTKEPYNFVDLQMRFKRYIVTNKYQESDKNYVFYLVNPVTGDEYKAYVADYLYMNVYFVGDTIK